MAEVAFLHYKPGHTLLHRLAGTVKLIVLMALSLLITRAGTIGLSGAALLLTIGTVSVRPPLGKMRRAMIFALLMAALLIFSQYRAYGWISETWLKGLRFLTVFWMGILFTAVTNPSELGDAFYHITRWIPFFPARRLATLITLTLSFLPLIMDESLAVERAAKSRCFYRRKNPFVRLRYRVEPLLEGVLRKSEEISRAMAARCYGEDK